jgi:hypothetical protein
VQVTRIYPVVDGKFPQAGVSGTFPKCEGFEWAAELTLTVYRCVAVADEDGLPSCEELTDDAVKILNDARAMRRAIQCCDWRNDELGDPGQIVIGDWRPLAPLGGCAGGQMTVIVLAGIDAPEPVG